MAQAVVSALPAQEPAAGEATVARIEVTERNGVSRPIAAELHQSVMTALKEGGVNDILALCGGCASCGTCHVYIDAAWLDRLPAMGEEEEEMLSLAAHRTRFSRLSCQIEMVPELDGLKLAVAPDG